MVWGAESWRNGGMGGRRASCEDERERRRFFFGASISRCFWSLGMGFIFIDSVQMYFLLVGDWWNMYMNGPSWIDTPVNVNSRDGGKKFLQKNHHSENFNLFSPVFKLVHPRCLPS